MTLGELIIKGIGWLARNPKSIVGVLPSPITRAKVRTTYNTENSATTFDADLMSEIRTLDASYVSYSDTSLQSAIDSAVPEDTDISNALALEFSSGGG